MPPIFPRTATGAIAAFGLFHAAPTLAQDAFTSLFVNAGGDAVQSEQQDWQADAHFTSGEAYADSARTQSGVQEVFQGTIYETQRIDRGEAVAYAVPAGEGLYALELHFAELWHRGGQSGRRVFDVEIEGQVIGRGLDTLAQTGGDADRAFVATIGGIDPAMSGAADRIEFRIIRGTDVPVLSAFALRCADGATCAAAPEPEPPAAEDAPAGVAVLDLSAPDMAATPDAPAAEETAEAGPAQPGTPVFEVRQFELWSNQFGRLYGTATEDEPLATASYDVLNLTDDPGRADAPYPDLAMFPMAAQQGHAATDGINDKVMLYARGSFTASGEGRYRFRTFNDDGLWLLVNGEQVIADPTFHGAQYFEGAVDLTAGTHKIEVVYMEADRSAILVVEAEQPDGEYGLLRAGQTLDPGAGGPVVAPDAVTGFFESSFNVTVPGGIVARQTPARVTLTSTDEVAVLHIDVQGVVNCHAVFTPAASFAAMTLEVHTCGETGGGYAVQGLQEGLLVVTGQVRNDFWTGGDWTFRLARQPIAMEPAATVRPDIPRDFAGVPFGPTVADVKAAVAARYTPVGQSAEAEGEGGWADRGGRGIGVTAQSLRATRGEGTGEDILTIASGTMTDVGGLIAYQRLAFPPDGRRATAEVLQTALTEKYGPASGAWAGAGRFGGLFWSFDTQGRKLRGDDARRCLSWDRREYRVPEWQSYRLTGGRPYPDVDMPPRSGCGVQVSVQHPVLDDPDARPEWTMFTAFDASARIAGEWEVIATRAARVAEEARATAQAEAAEEERIQAISPDL